MSETLNGKCCGECACRTCAENKVLGGDCIYCSNTCDKTGYLPLPQCRDYNAVKEEMGMSFTKAQQEAVGLLQNGTAYYQYGKRGLWIVRDKSNNEIGTIHSKTLSCLEDLEVVTFKWEYMGGTYRATEARLISEETHVFVNETA
jgi:hypothetical protein